MSQGQGYIVPLTEGTIAKPMILEVFLACIRRPGRQQGLDDSASPDAASLR